MGGCATALGHNPMYSLVVPDVKSGALKLCFQPFTYIFRAISLDTH